MPFLSPSIFALQKKMGLRNKSYTKQSSFLTRRKKMERKVTGIAEIQKRIAKCREHLRKSRDRENLKEGEQETVMFAKKLLEKEGFLVQRMREETDFEDEYDDEDGVD
jgi:hypothetical protein